MVKRFSLYLALTLLGLFIAALALEVGLRALSALRSPPTAWLDRPLFYFGAEGVESLQDVSHVREKPAGLYRIAVVGDSFTFAPFMQFTDAFPKQLERMLNLNHNARAEVINFGVPAYSTSHEVELVERVLEYKPDLVLLQITLNDPELKPYRPTGIRTDLPDRFGPYVPTGLSRYSHLVRLIEERLHNSKTHREYVDYFLDLFKNRRSHKVFVDSLTSIKQRCEKSEIPLVAVVFPLFGLPLDAPNYPFYSIHAEVQRILDDLEIPALDLFHTFSGVPLERLQVIPNGDRHPNEIAHRMAAETIYLWLDRLKLVPDPLRIKIRTASRIGIKDHAPVDEEKLNAEIDRRLAPPAGRD